MKFHHLHHIRPSGNKKLNDYTNTLLKNDSPFIKNVEGLSFIFDKIRD